ncbi:hypothetical protein SAMN04488070_1134 [Pseudidiomarina maritima]|uniref:Uncharacterized protein n=1 Tax=Pseudidiomarina maritima TaxID=519453 RepID=A0A1I6GS57_9GAMM|nr:hypothetical protein [Pseudidiomarina maritima]SFR44897.1 hypothetical protein SAMN04488070_1134 [Pseudidiomarina maritima]
MKKYLVIVPYGLHKGIVDSQIRDKFNFKKDVTIIEQQSESKFKFLRAFFINKHLKGKATVYTRSIFDFLLVWFLDKLPFNDFYIQFDFRGLPSEESYLRNKSVVRRYLIQVIESFVYRNADEIYCVSQNMKEYLKKVFHERPVIVEPCKIRADLLKNREVTNSRRSVLRFGYVGSMSVWQCFERVCCLYKSIESENTVLKVFTPDKAAAEKILYDYGVVNYECNSLPREVVISSLDEVDFGFILRDNNIVNTTASPLKFAEYISRGVIPIGTRYIGDYSQDFARLMYIVEDEEVKLDFNRLKDLLNARSYSALFDAASELTW